MKIQKNAMVSIELTLSDENGNVIEENDEELLYLHGGYGHLFQKLEDELEGKEIGDTFSVKLAPSEAFGEIREDLVTQELLSDLPEEIEVGMEMDGEEEGIIYRVLEIGETHARVDGNHHYAGYAFIAEGKVMEIEYLDDATVTRVLEDYHH
jgi:FKBP-type peptidyl-prolyl cis-trans isomerase SlyD